MRLHLGKEAPRLLLLLPDWTLMLVSCCKVVTMGGGEMEFEPPHLAENSFWNVTYGRVQQVIRVMVISIHCKPRKPSLAFIIKLSSSLDCRIPFKIQRVEESSVSQREFYEAYCCCHHHAHMEKNLQQRDHKSIMNCRIFLIIIYLSVNLEIYSNGQIVWKG